MAYGLLMGGVFAETDCNFLARKALKYGNKNGAGYRTRTRGPLITNQVLYQLS